MSNPPVCNVQGPVRLPDQKLAKFAPVPPATDLQGVIRALQVINNNFNMLARFGNFTENRNLRTYQTVRVFNPDNTDQWVDVLQITGLTFIDPVSGRTLVWRQ